MKKKNKDQSNNEKRSRPRTIVCKLLRFKDKQKIIQNSKKLRTLAFLFMRIFVKTLWTYVNNYGRKF